MEYFENKVVCSFNTADNQENQEDFCENSLCETENVDCGECIFSETYCKKEIFQEWKLNKENNNEQDGK